MKAVIFEEYGSAEVLRYEEVCDPTAGPGEIVVDVRATSVNAVDCKVRAGLGPYKANLPHILGRDFSGIVSALGTGVTDFDIGQPVFGVLDLGVEGAYAEKLVVKADIVAAKPDWLSHVDAAALALTGLTAIWALDDNGRLQAGETVLIQGGAGGVGGVAVQFAHHLGARVITTASAANHEYLKSLGADLVIDYTKEDFRNRVHDCDLVLDTVGGEVQVQSYDVIRPGGRLVWIAQGPDGYVPARIDVEVSRPATLRQRARLLRVLDLVASGALSVPPVQCFKMSAAAEAHRISEGRHLRGKLILEVG